MEVVFPGGVLSPLCHQRREEEQIKPEILTKDGAKLQKLLVRGHSALQKGLTFFGRLDKEQVETLDFLKAKQALLQPRNRTQKLAGLRVNPIKPLHLEISYKLLTAIFLYSPQKVAYPCSLDLPLIIRSFK